MARGNEKMVVLGSHTKQNPIQNLPHQNIPHQNCLEGFHNFITWRWCFCQIFLSFSPRIFWGRWSNLRSIFFRWVAKNHQLVLGSLDSSVTSILGWELITGYHIHYGRYQSKRGWPLENVSNPVTHGKNLLSSSRCSVECQPLNQYFQVIVCLGRDVLGECRPRY